ncbi:phiSA1p31-related protein, partial [Streptomyces sp. NPDC056291]|uniref:phiSA1p31-related protein n=1 Tax=Streptomyces sp. NPDC056291 TaxID=3345772 RepID=UPI0035DA4C01
IKVGDRVRVVKDDETLRTGQFVGKVGVINRLNSSSRLPYSVRFDEGQDAPHLTWNVAEVERVDADTVAVHDGVVYDLTAQYRDNEGDVWTFKRRPDGEVRGDYGPYPSISEYASTLASAVKEYGPLTRV